LVAGGAAAALAVGVISGAVMLRTPGEAREVRAGEVAHADESGRIEVAKLADLRREAEAGRRVPALEEALAKKDARIAELEKKLAAAEAAAKPAERAEAAVAAKPRAEDGSAAPAEVVVAAGERGGPAAKSTLSDAEIQAMIQKVDWSGGSKALVTFFKAQREGRPVDPSVYVPLTKLNSDVMALSKALGLEKPFDAYRDPRVFSIFRVAWYAALGADLDDDQIAAFEKALDAPTGEVFGDAPTYAGNILAKLRREEREEEALFGILRPDQLQRYLDTVRDDVYFGTPTQQKNMAMTSAAALADRVTDVWTQTFEIASGERDAVRAIAGRFVDGATAVPPLDPKLDPPTRRLACIKRAERIVSVQIEAEAALAHEPALSPEERERASGGAGFLLEVSISQQPAPQ
jgi:hypothetical protein